MLEDKRKDLDAEKRRKLLQRLLGEVSNSGPDVYYLSTSAIAGLIQDHIEKGAQLNGEERGLVSGLSRRDIEVLLSLH